MEFSRTTSAGYLVNHLGRLFSQQLARRIGALGLAPAQFMTLCELFEKDGQTQRELVEHLAVEQATMANTLGRLERNGLIERRPHPVDGRAQTVHLTQKARTLIEPARREAADVNADLMAGLPPAERDLFISMLTRLIAAAQSDREDSVSTR